MTTHRMEEFPSGISLQGLVEIAEEWNVPLNELYVEENYEMGGSLLIWLTHMT